MQKLFLSINKKINGIILNLSSIGLFILILAVLIVWTNFMLRLIIGLLAILIAYGFFYGAYKIWRLKKEIDKYLK
ncbi:MAG: hypothetical protein KAS78_04525 [Candidatus Pacebacteria bacterium]|nr:hypothetical protein [Candidatus Paceibacterota bacterium]